MSHKQQVISQLLASLERELRNAQLKVERLQEQVDAAKLLNAKISGESVSVSEPDADIIVENQDGSVQLFSAKSSVQLTRAKNVGDLAYQFLRDRCPGATVLELHKRMSETGAAIGSSEYLYTVCKKLHKSGRIRPDAASNGQVRYYAIEPKGASLVLNVRGNGLTQ